MSHDPEYHDHMVALMEMIWGEGYMAPGGAGNVARMLDGLQPRGKRILDIGSGIGGPALEMVTAHAARVTGIDLEAALVERARGAAERRGLEKRCEFCAVQPGPLPFDDAEFHIVTSAGAVTQTGDKDGLFKEVLRVLRPGGWFSCYEWFGNGDDLSQDMQYWLELEGLTYNLWSLERYRGLLSDCGFGNVTGEDATAWYRRESRREYELLRGELYDRLVDCIGSSDADHFVENWRAMVVVIESGEMRQGYFRGQKPE